jgi:hypothetical protein
MRARLSRSVAFIESLTILMGHNPIMQVLMLLFAQHSHPYQRVAKSYALRSRFDRWGREMNGGDEVSLVAL